MTPLKITAIALSAGFVALSAVSVVAKDQVDALKLHAKIYVKSQFYDAPRIGPHADPSAAENALYAINAPDAPPPAQILKKKTL